MTGEHVALLLLVLGAIGTIGLFAYLRACRRKRPDDVPELGEDFFRDAKRGRDVLRRKADEHEDTGGRMG